MAEQTVKYKVEIDQESLAAELAAVRQQLDMSMGAIASKGDVLPSAVNYANASESVGLSLPPVDIQQMAPVQVNQIVQPTEQGTSIFQMFDNAAEQTKLGFQKFSEDVRRVGLLQNSDPYMPRDEAALHLQGPQGFWRSLGSTFLPGALGGYDRDFSGMYRGDFQKKGIENIKESLDPFKAENLFAFSGAAIGFATGGVAGALGGFAAGGFADMIKQIAFAPLVEQDSLGKGFKAIAAQNFGNLTTEEADRMASIIQDKADSNLGRKLDYDKEVLQMIQTTFANAGGYSNVTSAEEMETLVKNTTDQYRRISEAMKLSVQETAVFMADLQKNMVTSGDLMADLSSRISKIAGMSGLSTTGVHNLGMSAINMLRGTGIGNSEAYHMSLDSLEQVERIRRNSDTGERLINQMGGIENAAIAQVESANRFMLSGQGMLLTASYMGGGSLGGPLGNTLSEAGEFISADPRRLLQLSANQGQLVGGMGFNNAQASMVMSAVQMMQETNFANDDGTVNVDALAGLMMDQYGISSETAKATILGFQDFIKQDPVKNRNIELMQKVQDLKEENDVGWWKRFTGSIDDATRVYGVRKHAFGGIYRNTQNGIDEAVEAWTDWTTGTTTVDRLKLSGDVREELRTLEDSKEYKEIFEKELEKATEVISAAPLFPKAPEVDPFIQTKIMLGQKLTPEEKEKIGSALLPGISETFRENKFKTVFGENSREEAEYQKLISSTGLVNSDMAAIHRAATSNLEVSEESVNAYADKISWADLKNKPSSAIFESLGFSQADPYSQKAIIQAYRQEQEKYIGNDKSGKAKKNLDEFTRVVDILNSTSDPEALAARKTQNEFIRKKEEAEKQLDTLIATTFKKLEIKMGDEAPEIDYLELKKTNPEAAEKIKQNFLNQEDNRAFAQVWGRGVKENEAVSAGLSMTMGDKTSRETLLQLSKTINQGTAAGALKTISAKAEELAAQDTSSPLPINVRKEYYESMLKNDNITGKDSVARVKDEWDSDAMRKIFNEHGIGKLYEGFEKENLGKSDGSDFLINARKIGASLEGELGASFNEQLAKLNIAGTGTMSGTPRHISQEALFMRLDNVIEGNTLRVKVTNKGILG